MSVDSRRPYFRCVIGALSLLLVVMASAACGGGEEEPEVQEEPAAEAPAAEEPAEAEDGGESAEDQAATFESCSKKIKGAGVPGDVLELGLDGGTKEVRLEFFSTWVNVIFFPDAPAAQEGLQQLLEDKDTEETEGRVGAVDNVVHYVSFDNLTNKQLGDINDCLAEAGAGAIPKAEPLF